MLKLNKDQKRLPFGGHQYHEYGMTFKGETFESVVEDLSKFRINNNIPIGKPEQDVLIYYADNWPWMVQEDREAQDKLFETNYQLWRDWIYKTWKSPPKKLVPSKEAKNRWIVCQECPHNLKKNWDTNEESSELERRVFILRKGIDVPEFCGFCSLHKADVGLLSLTDPAKDFSSKSDGSAYAKCWVGSLAGQ